MLPTDELARLRAFGGLQSYLSRTKDRFPVSLSLGSMGLGPAAPLFLALADDYLRDHFEAARATPERRFVALVGTRSSTRATSGRRSATNRFTAWSG
jgi:pyruvate dehydrogenase complex dehydrogenase (E1) component